jgi:hypothetical protein
VFTLQFGEVILPGLVLSQKEHGGFGEGPLELGVANLLAREPVPLARGLLGALDEATVGHKVLYPGEAGEVLDLIEDDQGQDLANAGHRLQTGEALRVMALGGARDIEFHLASQLVVVVDEGHVHCNGLAHARVREVLFHTLPIAFVRQLLAKLGEVVLAVGVLDVGQEFRPLAHERTTAPEQVAGRAPRRGVDVGHGDHPAAQQARNRVSVNLIVLGFAAVDGLHRESVAQDKGDPLAGTEIREPLPGEDTLHRDDQILAVGGNDP